MGRIKDLGLKVSSAVIGITLGVMWGISRSVRSPYFDAIFIILLSTLILVTTIVLISTLIGRNKKEPTTLERSGPIGSDDPDAESVKVCCPQCMTQQIVRGFRPFEVNCGRCGVTLVIPKKRR
jgi:ribosomal protein S27E